MTVTQAEQTEAAPFAPVDDEAGAPDRRKLALIGVAAAVVLAAAGYFLIGGGGGGSNTASSLVPSGRHLVKPAAAGNAPAANHPVLPPVSTVKLGRDPFHPLYVVPAAPTGPLPGSTSTGSTGGTGSTGTGTSTGTVTPPSKPVATTYSLRLSRVDGSGSDLTARFLIGSANKIQFARAGSVFGRSAEIRLLSIQKGANGAGTAVIQVGDGSPFDISTRDAAIFVL